MRYRRAVLLVDSGKDPGSAIAQIRRVAPRLEQLLVILPAPSSGWWWTRSEPSAESDAATLAALERLREVTVGLAPQVDVQATPSLGTDAIVELCSARELDLIVFGSRSLMAASVHRKRLPVAVLWAEGEPALGPIETIVCVAVDSHALAAIGSFLRDHSDRTMRVALLSPITFAPDIVASFVPVAGIEASVEVASPGEAAAMGEWLGEWIRDRPADLVVFVGSPSAALLGEWTRTRPVLLVPALIPIRSFGQRAIDVPDLVELEPKGPIRLRVDHVATVGSLAPVPAQTVAFVAGGRVMAIATTSSAGEAEVLVGLEVTSLGVYCVVGSEPPVDPLAAIEQHVTVIRAGPELVVVFDAELPDQVLRAVTEVVARSLPTVVLPIAVRLRPTRSCRSIRDRLRALGLPALVLDARAVLDEGQALDVSDSFDPVRLARAATRLGRAGFQVAAIVHGGPIQPLVDGFVALQAADLAGYSASASPTSPAEFGSELGGNHIEIELDNPSARTWLLDAIATSRETLHLQTYIAVDDDFGRAIEGELAAAGARGVKVRVLVDSLHGLHGSFGAHNPLLDRLSAYPGVELRVVRPITELPSLSDLKLRDHRKLVIRDGRVALIGGRNLAQEYYTGFAEVALTSESTWREVPWLDCGARIEGPAVERLAAAFFDAWTEAGGAGFELASSPATGPSAARVVVHRGLRDARTLEVYLDLIDHAKSHICVVNGFPLALELQHALVRALRRGVRVRTLFGGLAPTHGGAAFGGAWSAARVAATEIVSSRMDPIIAAGGEAHVFALSELPGWAPGLGVVQPNVHAKVMSVDGLRCTLGSANLDITAAYWESELLLVVEDAKLAGELEAQIDALMAGSIHVDRDDAAWQQLAKGRAWMRHWPALFSV